MIHPDKLKELIHRIAEEKKLTFNECWKQLLLERFLSRLAISIHSSKFIFKGGFLLSYIIKIGRETIDLDFLLTRMNSEEKELREVFEQIIKIHSSDGFAFAFKSIEPLNQPHMEYPGYRIILKSTFAKMKDEIQIDIGIGDIVNPLTFELPLVKYRNTPFFEDTISLLAYPVETIFSEKLETILSRGSANSRMKDYHDLIMLIRNQEKIDTSKLVQAIRNTFSHRGTTFKAIQFHETEIKNIQRFWTAHLNNGNYSDELTLPKDILLVIDEINRYVTGINSG